jgi:hypothetical protein
VKAAPIVFFMTAAVNNGMSGSKVGGGKNVSGSVFFNFSESHIDKTAKYFPLVVKH